MKYRYYFTALQCNRFYTNFMRTCDLNIEDVGIQVKISFISDIEPTQENISKLEKIIEQTQNEKNLETYFRNVKCSSLKIIEEEENE